MSTNEPIAGQRENIFGSRKTAGFVIMVLSILALVALVSKLHTPNEVSTAALYCIAIGGLFTMGGQALVDSVAKWRSGIESTTSSSVKERETTVIKTADAVKA